MHDIERKRVVGVAIRQREEVSPANEEVAVEVGDAEAPCAADAHDSLEAGRAQQAPLELGLELDAVAARVEGGVVLEGARSVLGQARERRHIRVLRGEEEKVDADLEARELDGLGLVPLLARVEHDVLLVRTQRAWVLAVLESRLADARQVAQEHHHLTADVALDAVGCDEGGAERAIELASRCKHRRERVEQRVNDVAAVGEVDEQVVGQRQEQLGKVRYCEHLRLAQARLQVEEVDGRVEREEADLRAPTRHARQLVKTLLDRRHRTVQHTRAHRARAHVHHKDVHRRLWRPQHVLGRRDQLDRTLAQLRPLGLVTPLPVLVEVGEVSRRDLVHVAADITPPLPPIVQPVHERVDVGAAPLTPHDTRSAEVDHVDRVVVAGHVHRHRV
mmetsp:Transcript_8916/g.20835  ORF Transcript_8916/g.20835 Transcript_8916/m.20835 type:complete len:390 (-) Transcript_8916:493-1662(-)